MKTWNTNRQIFEQKVTKETKMAKTPGSSFPWLPSVQFPWLESKNAQPTAKNHKAPSLALWTAFSNSEFQNLEKKETKGAKTPGSSFPWLPSVQFPWLESTEAQP
jgi:hypothetical protein